MKKILSFLQTLFFPKECLSCNSLGEFICPECLKKIPIRPSQPPEKIRYQDYLDQVHIASFYNYNVLARLIDLYKFHYQQHLGNILATLAVTYIKKNKLTKSLQNFVIVPIPLHHRRYLERGFNQSEILATEISVWLQTKLITNALIRHRYNKHQTKLNMHQRQKNISGVFSIANKERIIGKKILLVDDVVTTGASLNEAAKVLRQNGANKVIGLVLAKN